MLVVLLSAAYKQGQSLKGNTFKRKKDHSNHHWGLWIEAHKEGVSDILHLLNGYYAGSNGIIWKWVTTKPQSTVYKSTQLQFLLYQTSINKSTV